MHEGRNMRDEAHKAREQANLVQCSSNLRQMGIAAMMFKDDHRQRMQPVSDTSWFRFIDPQQNVFAYRDQQDASGRWVALDDQRRVRGRSAVKLGRWLRCER